MKAVTVTCALLMWAAFTMRAEGAAHTDRPIVLPPLLVEEMKTGPRWRYARVAGYEIIARCRDKQARDAVAAYHRAREVLRTLLPDRFVGTFDVPNTLILYAEDLWPATSHDAIASMLGASHQSTDRSSASVMDPVRPAFDPLVVGRAVPGHVGTEDRSVEFLRNLRLSDADATASFALIPRSGIDPGSKHLTVESVGEMLGKRTPALPSWFVAGFLNMYGQLEFGRAVVEAAPLVWLSKEDMIAIRRGGPSALLRLADLFGADALMEPQWPIDRSVWLAQAELWVRWGLMPGETQRTEAFWRFLERAAAEPVDESAFHECFGKSYAEAEAELAAFIPVAISRRVRWRVAETAELPPFEFRDAAKEEVARIKGDWERLETRYVRHHMPLLASQYADQARKTLSRGGDDAGVAAVLGLAEMDDGNEAAAAKYLERATQAAVIRPRAYCEYARLLFASLRDRSLRNDGKLTVEEARRVIDALAPARAQAPKLAEVYNLIAEVWLNTAGRPSPEDLAMLDEGLAAFPRRAELFYRTAKLNFESGAPERGTAVAESGLRVADTAARRSQLRELLETWQRIER